MIRLSKELVRRVLIIEGNFKKAGCGILVLNENESIFFANSSSFGF